VGCVGLGYCGLCYVRLGYFLFGLVWIVWVRLGRVGLG
jgi:hypothetical protein